MRTLRRSRLGWVINQPRSSVIYSSKLKVLLCIQTEGALCSTTVFLSKEHHAPLMFSYPNCVFCFHIHIVFSGPNCCVFCFLIQRAPCFTAVFLSKLCFTFSYPYCVFSSKLLCFLFSYTNHVFLSKLYVLFTYPN